ncbi:MAG: serine protein kinase RIO [Candidatus Micrarchaeota archaeon]
MTLKEQGLLKIYQRVFDEYTLRELVKLSTKGHFQSLDFPISTGKEADVYRATKRGGGYIAIKIYRIEMSNFRAMQNYMIGDPRFRKTAMDKRSIVTQWCQKEYRNLLDARKAGVRVPKPIKAVNNILLMEFLGDSNGCPAPLLRRVAKIDDKKIVSEWIRYIGLLWKKAGIVHGDLNEYNTVIKGRTPYLIDIGQAMSVEHPTAKDLLKRDLLNVSKYAKKHGVKFDAEKEFEKLAGQ